MQLKYNIQNIKFNSSYSKILTSDYLSDFKEYVDITYLKKHIVVVIDSKLQEQYLASILEVFSNTNLNYIFLNSAEKNKTFASVDIVINKLIDFKASRDTILFSFGGGTISDITGFVASVYMRGINWGIISTSLLSQVDACVGGKTGVNYKSSKNLIGSFCHPEVVFIPINVLETLQDREYNAGLAEIIKYGLAFDKYFFDYLVSNKEQIKDKNKSILKNIISRSINYKAKVVVADEKETIRHGGRALLNLGHTFGHAIETITAYKEFLHGEAVGLGILLAARLSVQLGFISSSDEAQITDLISFFCLPTKLPEFTAKELVSIIYRDKKFISGKLRLVLLRKIGEAVVYENLTSEELEEFLYGYQFQKTKRELACK